MVYMDKYEDGGTSMNNVRINNEVNLTYPDGFAEMNEEALAKYFGSPANRWGVYDGENHVILSVSWTKGGFFSFLTDAESMLIGVEGRMRRNLLNYQRISSYKTKIGKKKAYGIRFEYRVNTSKMVQVGDLVSFKHKKNYYAIHLITRKTNAAAPRVAFEETLKSITVG